MRAGLTPFLIKLLIARVGHWRGKACLQSYMVAITATATVGRVKDITAMVYNERQGQSREEEDFFGGQEGMC